MSDTTELYRKMSIWAKIGRTPPVVIDGIIAVSMSGFVYLQTQFGLDESLKYLPATLLYLIKLFTGLMATMLTAFQFFRSKSYADYRIKKENGTNGNGSQPQPPKG